MAEYNLLVIGSGLYGSVIAHKAQTSGLKTLVIEKRDHIGGNCATENIEGINVHKYGPHIFHTSNKDIWDFVNSFVPFNNFINSPLAYSHGKLFNLPFNMNTFYQVWKTKHPNEAKARIEATQYRLPPKNLEEQAMSLVGKDIYEIFIKNYTEKQWGRPCTELSVDIIKRLPIRFTYNNNYYNDVYQGIPIGGYQKLFNGLLSGVDVWTNTDYFSDRERFDNIADRVLYTGKIDEYFDYQFGPLEYRSLRFETEILQEENFQGNAVVNYVDKTPYTRIVEHKHFENSGGRTTVITKEFSQEWDKDKEAYYAINNDKNNKLFAQYKELAAKSTTKFGGRLADYSYYDMDKVIEKALKEPCW